MAIDPSAKIGVKALVSWEAWFGGRKCLAGNGHIHPSRSVKVGIKAIDRSLKRKRRRGNLAMIENGEDEVVEA